MSHHAPAVGDPGDRSPSVSPHRVVVIGAVLAWLFFVGLGFEAVRAYSATPGQLTNAPAAWPSASQLPTSAGPRIVMFVHPKCPCTRASLAELREVIARDGSGANALVVFHQPASASPGWVETASWDSAAGIPRTTRVLDVDGREAARFGAETSGHIVMYDAAGRLAFAGGITAARGHVGDNAGRRALIAALAGAASPEHAVYGCPLGDADEARRW